MSSCQHDPFENRTTLHVETDGSQVRIRCVACDRYVMVSRNGVLQTRPTSETPADLVGALQDRVHTDAGPFRAGQSVKETPVAPKIDAQCACGDLDGFVDCPVHI